MFGCSSSIKEEQKSYHAQVGGRGSGQTRTGRGRSKKETPETYQHANRKAWHRPGTVYKLQAMYMKNGTHGTPGDYMP